MARKGNQWGRCRICGKVGELSFEHVPPKSAYNKATVVEYALEDWAAKRKVKGKRQQGGVGDYTLCEQCNNDTGSWYASEYVKWARTSSDVLSLIEQHRDHFSDTREIAVTLKGVYPQRFLKQVVTCLLSVIDANPRADNAHSSSGLTGFVLDRNSVDLPLDYCFYLRLYRSPMLRRYPIAGRISVTYEKGDDGAILPQTLRAAGTSILSEVAHPPFALIMTHDSSFPDATDITYFKRYGYDEKVDLVVPLKIGRSSSPLPGNFEP